MAQRRKQFAELALAAVIVTILSACGGGGGGSQSAADQADIRRPLPALAMSSMTPGLTLLAGYAGGSGTLDGTGTSARFSAPVGIAIDPADNILVTDQQGDSGAFVLRKISPAGVVTTVSGPASQASTVDHNGNRYIAAGYSIVKVSPDGTASSLAGDVESSGFTDGIASDARFTGIGKMVTDQAGNLYVINTKITCQGVKPVNCTFDGAAIRKISPSGAVTTLAGYIGTGSEAGLGDGVGAAARFTSPYALTIDGAGNLFVADSGFIRRISTVGEVTTLPRDPRIAGDAFMVRDLLVATDNTLLALSTDKLYRVDPTGVMTLVADFAQVDIGIGQPYADNRVLGLAADSAGSVFVLSYGAVYKIGPGGVPAVFAGMPVRSGSVDGKGPLALFRNAQSMARDADGNLYVAEEFGPVRKIAQDGTVSTLGSSAEPRYVDETGAAVTSVNPRGIAAAPDGTVYLGDFLTIRKLSKTGVLSIFAGTPGTFGDKDGIGTNASFSSIRAMVADSDGNLYVAEAHSVRKVTPSGVVTTLAGSSTGGSADGKGASAFFNFPSGITLDSAGNLYVADTENATIRKLSPEGVVTTVAGSPLVRGLVDGTGSAARFNKPKDMAADAAGNVYVVDSNTVRKITPAGVVTTIAGRAQFTGTRLGDLPGNFSGVVGITYLGANVLAVSDGTSVLRLAVP